MKIVVKTFFGLEDVLAKEIETLGLKDIEPLNRAVSCSGTLEDVYKLNIHLRTGLKVLIPLFEFNARSDQELYNNIYSFDWSKLFDIKQTFALETTVYSQYFNHSQYVGLKAKDAIVDQFRNKVGDRPNVNTENPDVLINIHVNKEHATVSLDSSGDSLHKRGYRIQGHLAPLNEVLAAGMVLLSEWNGETPLFDLMCGTGTILMEATMIALKMPPNLNRDEFGFKNWKNFKPQIYNEIKAKAKEQVTDKKLRIIGNDNDKKALDIAEASFKRFGFEQIIKLSRKDFSQFKPVGNEGIIIMNPPYGERMEEYNLVRMYRNIGTHFKHHFEGFEAWVISSDWNAIKQVGLRPSKKHTLFNGALECKYNKFEMYGGSKKSMHRD